MRILLIGDVNGRAGLHMVQTHLPRLIAARNIDFSIANVENAADGFGITPDQADQLLDTGLDCLTSGNHIWDKQAIVDYLAEQPRLLRPVNYPAGTPGSGIFIGASPAGTPVAVVNLMGRVFMPPCEDPFMAADRCLKEIGDRARIVIFDMHAEATSEKVAIGWHLDGRASAVVGTHTHIQTADERLLPGGTAYITDLGMTGPYDSVIGIDKTLALKKFRTGLPVRFSIARNDPRLCGVVVDIDDESGRARAIERIEVRANSPAGSPVNA